MNILERYKKPTPKFFRILRNLGVSLATAGGTILTAPVNISERLLTFATYLILIGTVVSAVSQAAVEDDSKINEPVKNKDHEL